MASAQQRILRPWVLSTLALSLFACGPDKSTADPAADFQRWLQTQLIEAEPGDVIEIPAGFHSLTRGLSLTTDNVTIRGAGMDQTILSFREQVQGAEGLLVSADDFTITDLAIEDAKGDALKVNEGKNIVIRNVRTEWTDGPSEHNGAYGIYPVQSSNVLVEDCVAIAASDAGIYVGQSTHIVVRRNRAEYNVAGIEIENSVYADVYENVARHNTGGILVFNLPNMPQLGHSTRVYDNVVEANNTDNFAPAGTAVSTVPAGSGVIVSSNDKVEIFHNTIADNRTANIWISSFLSSGLYGKREMLEGFDPYPETIFIYGNSFSGGGERPDREVVEKARVALFGETGRVPDIVWDGHTNPAPDGTATERHAICVDNGAAQVLNVDSPNENRSPHAGLEGHACQHDKLAPVELDGVT